ncbi:hypothetical protein RP20_CCG023611 [Aedes albopictus]|nr:hypothetical protein RP20_CCG023611 [Aedes albopictus]
MKLLIITVSMVIVSFAVAADIPCDKQCLGPNEVFQDCASLCPATCDSPYGNSCTACSPGCACMDGYVRNASYVCVLLCDCPSGVPTTVVPAPV